MGSADLIECLEKLTGPSREVDADIYEALGYEVKRKPERIVTTWRAGWSKSWAYFDMSTRRWIAMGRLTHSLDAIVALIEQKLPGWIWDVTSTRTAWLMDPENNFVPEAKPSLKAAEWRPATHAIAMCLALLKAMEAGQ